VNHLSEGRGETLRPVLKLWDINKLPLRGGFLNKIQPEGCVSEWLVYTYASYLAFAYIFITRLQW